MGLGTKSKITEIYYIYKFFYKIFFYDVVHKSCKIIKTIDPLIPKSSL